MKSVVERIMEYAEASPEATPTCLSALLHLGKRRQWIRLSHA